VGEVNIEDARIPLTIIATDASNGDKLELKEGPVNMAVMASSAIPGIFKPIKLQDRLLIDGGIVENIPTQTLKDNGADFVIGVDLHTGLKQDDPANIIDVILNSFHFSILSAARLQTRVADILIQPDLNGYNRTDTKQVKELIKIGYEEALPLLEKNLS
jgi:NTE family protein